MCVYVCGNDVELEGCGKSLLGKRDACQSGTSEIGFGRAILIGEGNKDS